MNTELTFSEAVAELKLGNCVTRTDWNGKGMKLFMVDNWDITECTLPAAEMFTFSGAFMPFIAMLTAQGDIVPWLASQGDMLSNNWEIVK